MKKTFTKIASMCCLAIFALMTNVAVAQDGCTDAGAINFDPAAVNDDGSCVVPGCADAPTIFNYCYDNNAADVLTWNEATAGSGVAINFTAGTVEAGFDVITIYDGPDNLSPILFSGDGDVTGLVFGSTGASLTVEITSDGSFSCVDGLITPAISVEIYCAAAVDGCTNPAGCDFDPLAVNDTGCDFSCYGCTDAGACNFDPAATIDDSSCDFSCVGCIDPSGCDFDPAFTIDGGCDFSCIGCTDAAALNFEADNTVEDGSCIFPGCADAPTNFTICYGENSTQTITLTEANAGEGVTLDILAGTTEAGFDTFNVYDGASNLAPLLFTAEGDLTGSVIQSTGADLTIEILSDGSVSCQSGAQTEISIDVYCAPVALGCTDATACNFDAAALTDDGSCEFTTCAGCTDSNATNFDPSATIDDGTCVTCAAGELLVTIDMVDTFGDGWNGNEYILSDGGGIISQNDLDNALIGDGTDFGQDLFCLAPGCYTLDVIEGGFPGEVQISVLDNLGNTYFTGGSPTAGQGLDIGTTGTCGFTGCTDPAAINFDINASVDDGSCILPPPNDTACTAEAIACGSSIIGNTTNSSDAEGLIGSNCSSIDVTSSGVWYEFNALADEQIFLSTCATTSGVDTKIHVYEAAPDCNNLVCVAANDDSPSCPAGSFLSEVVFNATTGTTYFVLVSEFGAGVGGEFNLDVICVDCTDGTPANDACENAAICISGVPTTQSICCANAAVQNDFGGFATTYDVWFVVNSGTFDNVAISAQTAGASNVGLTIYDGADCANLNSAAGGGPVTAEIAGNLSDFVTVVPNTDYLFQVWTTDPAGCGDITFVCEGQFLGCTDPSADNFDATATADDGSCTYTNIPANDECANAEVLVCNTTITGSTGGATTTGQPIGIVDCDAAPGTGVWYTFVGTGELHTLNTCGSIIDSKLNVYESDADCAGVLTCVGAAQDGLVACGFFDQDDTELSFTSTAGLNYYVYVSSEGAEGLFDLSFTCETIVEGCTNPVACDFDPAANVDTGCDFFSCACDLNPTGFGLQVNMVTTFGNGWNGATYEIFDGAGVSITSGDLDNADFSEDVDNVEGPDSGFDIICLDAGCYSIVVGGAGFLDFANSFSIADENGVEIAAGGSETVLFTVGGAVCGCTDATACNFDAAATDDDGTCEFTSCAGCTDNTACNYDASATIEDGSCCFENCVTFEMNDTFGDGWNFAIYEVFDAATNTLVASGDLDNAQSGDGLSIGTDILCLADGCYYLNVTEGDFATEISWILSGINGGIEIGGAPTTELFFSVGAGDCVVGCDNPLACNFDAATVISDCTLCEFDSCQGCTYEVATNYDATATIDDGSCDIVPVDDCPGDFNDDNVINAGDLLSFLGAFGTTCE